MDDIQIKEEPMDYDDIFPEKHIQVELEEAKDINLHLVKTEPVDNEFVENVDFASFPTSSSEDASINCSSEANADTSDDYNVDFMEFVQVLSRAQKHRTYHSNEEYFECVFKCGGTFSNWDECKAHEIEEAKRFYQNGKLPVKKRKISEQNEEQITLLPKTEPPDYVESVTTNIMSNPGFIQNIEIKKEISEDLEPDKNLKLNRPTPTHIIDNKYEFPGKIEVKEEQMDEEELHATPIPKIKIPASLLNSLKAAQNVPKPDINALKYFHKNDPPFELKHDTTAQKISKPKPLIKSPNREPINVPVQIPNTILQPITVVNTPFKMINPNMKILKLPPNTKIIKLDGNTSPEKSNITSILPQIIQNGPIQNTKKGSSEAETILKEAIIKENKRQKVINFVPKPTLELIEQLPESRKAISELLQKVREAESRNTESYMSSEEIEHMQHDINKKINPKANISSNLNSDDSNSSSSSTTENQLTSIFIEMKGDDSILFRMRRLYPHFRCFWLCPYCPRQYALRNTLRSHLERLHQLAQIQLDSLLLEVKIFHLGADAPEFESVLKSSISATVNEQDSITNIMETRADKSKECFNCKKCGRKCSSKVALRDHVAANCSREPQYQCSQCPKKFFSVSTLNCHVTIHTGELPHKCSYCDKRFRTRGQVTVHHRTHTGERPFKCQVCSQSFTHRETLIAHLSRHIGMKRYKCYACNKQFSCISGLRTHRDTRPDTCGKVKFNPRALGPRVRVVKGNVIFEPQPEINPYLRSDSPPDVATD